MENSDSRHYAVIDTYNRKLTLTYKGEVVAVTEQALILKEVAKTVYNPVFYIPKEDVVMKLNPENSRKSHCPIKGDASYWNLDKPTEEYFAWSYEAPHPRSKKIKGHVAFNLNYLTLVSEPV